MIAINKVYCAKPLRRTMCILLREGLVLEKKTDKLQWTKLTLHFCFCTIILGIDISGLINAIKSHNISVVNQLICMIISAVTAICKGVTALKNKNCFASVVEDLKSVPFNMHSNELNRHIKFIDRISKLTLKYYVLLSIAFFTVSCFLPFIFDIKTIIPAPSYMEKYDFFYKILHSLVILYLCVNAVCFDVSYLSMLGLCIGQLLILEERLVNIGEAWKETIKMELNEKSLKECIILHEAINQYVKKLNVVLAFPLFIQYTCGCFIICNTILQLTLMKEADATDALSIIVYSGATFSQLGLFHWLGNEIIFKSNKIIEWCYLSQWYTLSNSSQINLILLMERAKRPLSIELYTLAHMSLDSLGAIVRWSYSLFALIKATYK